MNAIEREKNTIEQEQNSVRARHPQLLELFFASVHACILG
jgi:hypothetical protein